MRVRTMIHCCMAILIATFTGGESVRAACAPDTLLRIVDNPAPEAGEFFGIDVTIGGDLVIVGAPFDHIGGVKSGAAYVYDLSTGALRATLTNPAPEEGDYLGVSTSISGRLAAIGACFDSPQNVGYAGSAYVFNADTGALISTLNNPAPNDHDEFGYCVRISGEKVIVGSIYDDLPGASNAGKAFIFDALTGALKQTLLSPNPNHGAEFGIAVAIEGDVAAVGAWGASGGGAVYIYNASTGALVRTIHQPHGGDSTFGFSVCISGDLLAVGQPRDGYWNAGAAYVLRISTGELIRTLYDPQPADGDEFGISVSISGEYVIAGCWNQGHEDQARAGGAYVFNAISGTLLSSFPAPASSDFDRVGSSVWIDGGNAAVGGFHRRTAGITDSGQAFIYTASDGRSRGDFDCSGCTDLNDFLFLLSNWWEVSSIGGGPMEIEDFFNFLDHWTTGAACP